MNEKFDRKSTVLTREVSKDFIGYTERKQEYEDEKREAIYELHQSLEKKGFISGSKAW